MHTDARGPARARFVAPEMDVHSMSISQSERTRNNTLSIIRLPCDNTRCRINVRTNDNSHLIITTGMITRARPEVIITTHRRSTSLPIMSASTMGDCLNTALDNIFISCPIIELINEVCTPERPPRARKKGDNRRERMRERVPISLLISICARTRFLKKDLIGSNCCSNTEIRKLISFRIRHGTSNDERTMIRSRHLL